MIDNKSLLILRLEGASQSWGEISKWDFRDCSDFPTKSGIVGLIGCAMGIARSSVELFDLSNAMTLGVRADRPGIRSFDFQTVTGNPLLTAEGKPRKNGNTIISNHVYLQDACFTVFIEINEIWKKRIISALSNPKWCIFLGRKNCVPSRPVLECTSPHYSGLMEAIKHYPVAKGASFPLSYETETENADLSCYTRTDAIQEGYRNFSSRRIWRGIIKEENNVSMEN